MRLSRLQTQLKGLHGFMGSFKQKQSHFGVLLTYDLGPLGLQIDEIPELAILAQLFSF